LQYFFKVLQYFLGIKHFFLQYFLGVKHFFCHFFLGKRFLGVEVVVGWLVVQVYVLIVAWLVKSLGGSWRALVVWQGVVGKE